MAMAFARSINILCPLCRTDLGIICCGLEQGCELIPTHDQYFLFVLFQLVSMFKEYSPLGPLPQTPSFEAVSKTVCVTRRSTLVRQEEMPSTDCKGSVPSVREKHERAMVGP